MRKVSTGHKVADMHNSLPAICSSETGSWTAGQGFPMTWHKLGKLDMNCTHVLQQAIVCM